MTKVTHETPDSKHAQSSPSSALTPSQHHTKPKQVHALWFRPVEHTSWKHLITQIILALHNSRKLAYPNIIHQHLIQTNWPKRTFHNVGDSRCSSNCTRERKKNKTKKLCDDSGLQKMCQESVFQRLFFFFFKLKWPYLDLCFSLAKLQNGFLPLEVPNANRGACIKADTCKWYHHVTTNNKPFSLS